MEDNKTATEVAKVVEETAEVAVNEVKSGKGIGARTVALGLLAGVGLVTIGVKAYGYAKKGIKWVVGKKEEKLAKDFTKKEFEEAEEAEVEDED